MSDFEEVAHFQIEWSPMDHWSDISMDEDLENTLLQIDALDIPLYPPETNIITTVAEIHSIPSEHTGTSSSTEQLNNLETAVQMLPELTDNAFVNNNVETPSNENHIIQNEVATSNQFDSNHIDMTEEEIQNYILLNENRNTAKKTMYDIKLVQKFLKMKNENREIQNIPPCELDSLLANFLITVRKKDGQQFEPSTLKGIVASIDRKLKRHKYGHSIINDKDNHFQLTKETLKTKLKVLKKEGKGNKPKRAQPLTDIELNSLYQQNLLGGMSPEAMLNTLWLNNTVHFGLRGVKEHYDLRWGDITLHTSSDGKKYLELNERQTKTRTGENINDVREVSPKMFECLDEKNPIAIYEKFASKRPSGMSNENDPFYLATRTIPLTGADNEPWFVRQRVGVKKLASIVKKMQQKGNLDANKRLTNHSARKYLVQKLKDHNIQDTDIMQISGHKNVQSIRNYSSINEDKHKEISNVLSNTSVSSHTSTSHSQSCLPGIFTSASSESVNAPVSSVPGVDTATFCAQTNTSNRLNSMFYGATLQIQTMNVYMCDRH